MLGGYQIINLTGINVALNSEMTAISDRGVLIQLLALREYIEDNYNFTRPLNKKLKPVMLRLRDKESGEKTESSAWANIAIIDDNLSFNIDAIVSVNPLRVLQINVVFQKLQDEDENDYYDIKSAGYLYKGGNDVVTVSDIKDIDSDIIDKLQCGDIVLKHDSSGDHAYIVSYRGATGICLTYTDASVIETQSYDLIDDKWVYNSEDKTLLPINGKLDEDIVVKTLIQTQPNFELDLSDVLVIENAAPVNSYCKFIQYGNVLYLVVSSRFVKTDGTSTTYTIDNIDVQLPDEIASKIYDKEGVASNLSPTTVNMNIATFTLRFFNQEFAIQLQHKSAGVITINFSNVSLSATAQGGYNIDGRTFIVL